MTPEISHLPLFLPFFLPFFLLWATVLLVASFFIVLFTVSYRCVSQRSSAKGSGARGGTPVGPLFFYESVHRVFFGSRDDEGIAFVAHCARHLLSFFYVFFVASFVELAKERSLFSSLSLWGGIFCSFIALFLVGDFFPRSLGNRFSEAALRTSAPLASGLLLLTAPLSWPLLKGFRLFMGHLYLEPLDEEWEVKREIMEILQGSQLSPNISPQEKKLIASALKFREPVAREVMVPRVDVFSLSAKTTIAEAASLLLQEGYSRVPVYKDSVDNVVGVLMYKDLLQKYLEYTHEEGEREKRISILEAPISTIQKSVLYVPETKKISSLLQEFRKKQIHMAIVVDEYGGTGGIITIEDILEQIVGEIADEYDVDEELLYVPVEGGWIVDARMSLLDVEEQLGIVIAQDGDYDTIGGYLFHCAGTIPQRGFSIHHDDFEITVLRSNERCVEQVRISQVPSEEPLSGGGS